MPFAAKKVPDHNKFLGLEIRYRADKSKPKDENGSYPEIGMTIENPVLPEKIGISTRAVSKIRERGYLSVVGERPVNYPGGPPGEPFKKTHTMIEHDVLVFHTMSGDVKYEVVRQPGKYGIDLSGLLTQYTVEDHAENKESVVFWDYRCVLISE